MERFRSAAREKWQELRDQISVLENLYAAAAATAVLAVALEWLLGALSWQVPAVLSPGLGFAIAAIVAGMGYLRGRDRRRECRSRVAGEIEAVLDRPFIFGSPEWMMQTTLRSGESITVRALAGASREGHLQREVWGNEYRDLAERLRSFANEFERATSHCMTDLGPPRARSLIDQVIRELGRAADAADTTWSRFNELVGSVSVAELAEESSFRGLTTCLEDALAAGEDLQEIVDRERSRAAAAERGRAARERRQLQEAFNAKVIAGAEWWLTGSLGVAELEHSTLLKARATLEEVAADEHFAFEPRFARPGWTSLWQQIDRAMVRFREPLGAASHEAVHLDTLEFMNTVARIADELARKCQYLIERLDDASNLEDRLREVRRSISDLVAELNQAPSLVRSA